MRKAFTLIELVVALGILAAVLSFAGVIFRVSIGAQRLAMANAEVMQKLRVITEQLDADFRGILVTYGGRFDAHTGTYNGVQVNSDCIAFFADGDFQSTRQYGGQTIVGNVASILYGPPDPNSYTRFPAPQDRLLLRRQTILAPKAPQADSSWQGEYCCLSLEQWRVNPPFTNPADWAKLPAIDPNKLDTQLLMYLAKGVDNFTISYLEHGAQLQTESIPWKRVDNQGQTMIAPPRAFKFEFTLYDSKGMIRGGRTFSHIVLLDR